MIARVFEKEDVKMSQDVAALYCQRLALRHLCDTLREDVAPLAADVPSNRTHARIAAMIREALRDTRPPRIVREIACHSPRC